MSFCDFTGSCGRQTYVLIYAGRAARNQDIKRQTQIIANSAVKKKKTQNVLAHRCAHSSTHCRISSLHTIEGGLKPLCVTIYSVFYLYTHLSAFQNTCFFIPFLDRIGSSTFECRPTLI